MEAVKRRSGTTDFEGRTRERLYFALGLAACVGLAYTVFAVSNHQLRTQFNHSQVDGWAAPHAATVMSMIDHYVEGVHSVAGLYAASEKVERDEFRAFHHRIIGSSDVVQALEWVPRVAAPARAAFEEEARRDGHPSFELTEQASDGGLVPAKVRDEYYPVYFVEPLQGNEAVLGFDLGSNPERLRTLLLSRDTGEATATERIHLVQGTESQFGFLVAVPIYESGIVPETLDERRASLKGFALGVFRVDRLIESTLRRSKLLDVFEVAVLDMEAKPGNRLLHYLSGDHAGGQANWPPEDQLRTPDTYRTFLDVGGRDWVLSYRLKPGSFAGYLSAIPWLMAGAAGLLALWLVLHLRATRQRASEIAKLVEERNCELIETNDALKQEMTERKRVQEQFKHAQRMDAIGQLTGGIAHDFNNLLMVIDGHGRRALTNIGDVDKACRSLEEVLSATERAALLTKSLLVFSRRQVMEKRVFCVADTIRDLKGMLTHSVGEWYKIRYNMEDKTACVETGRNELTQAIVNLAINARDAMPKGGEIDIGVGCVELDKELTVFRCEIATGRYVVISVKDQGTGIDEETLQHIFEPFFSTKEQGAGSGLGLSMVYGFVKQSGGFVDVATEPGKGTTFYIYLPVVDRPPDTVVAEIEGEFRGRGEKILLVEDDDRLLELTHDMLCDLGYQVYSAGTGLEALEIDDDLEESIDILVTDVVMPSLGGFELHEILKERRPDLRAVFISGYPQRGTSKVSIPEGVPFLQKPVVPQTLARTIRARLDGRESPSFVSQPLEHAP